MTKILSKCLQVQYNVIPVPSKLSDSIKIYEEMGRFAPLIEFRQDQCPVTKQRLGTIRATFHDVERFPGYEDFPDGHIVKQGMHLKNDAEMSKLEKELVELKKIEDFNLDLDILTRNEDSVTYRRDKKFADVMGVPRTGTEKERVIKAEEKVSDQLDGFLNLLKKE